MTPRPSITRKQRPLSAIFIGSLGSSSSSTPPDLPRLPEPPSPEESSPQSRTGLPSPPATNSTGSGSGSNGDDSTNPGSLRERKSQRPYSTSEMYNGARNKSHSDIRSAGSSAIHSDEDDDPNDHEHDEDTTARFDLHRRRSTSTVPGDHDSAMQRVKSLTERNRMILDKISSMSRHGSPVPPKPNRSSNPPSHTPSPPSQSSSRPPSSARFVSSSSRAETSSRAEASSFSRSRLFAHNHGNSGSETEREGSYAHSVAHTYSSSDSMPTPTSQHSEVIFSFPVERTTSRQRRISAPNSPGKMLSSRTGKLPDRNISPPPSPGPPKARTPRKRASMAVTASEREQSHVDDEGKDDVMSAALAAVASSRRSRSPGGSGAAGSVSRRGLNRNPMPREFREQSGREFDSRDSEQAVPYTPRRNRDPSKYRRSPSPSERASTSQLSLPLPNGQYSPKRHGTPARTSTVRELTRRHQTRWLSEDLSASAHGDIEDNPGTPSRSGTSQAHYSAGNGRRPTGRGGSDGPASPGRSLLGEGLRAAGIGTRRRDPGAPDDPFGGSQSASTAHAPPVRRTRSTGAKSVIQDGVEWDSPVQGIPNNRLGDQTGGRVSDYTTPDTRRFGDRAPPSASSSTRPGTSMAALHHDNPSARAIPATPMTGRSSTFTPGIMRDSNAEHRRLMLEALGMFESHLARLPPMGQTTTSTIPEVFQNTQHIVHDLDRLNNLLRTSTSKALQSQIEAEVGDSDSAIVEIAEIWAQVGADSREHLRVSDEIVRTMTQFLLGVGKIMRDASGVSTSQHARSVSMDEEIGRRLTPDASSAFSDKRSSDGRLSRETRRSWEPREAAQAISRISSMDRTSNGTSSRPPSSAQPYSRSSAASSSEGRGPNEGGIEQSTPASRHLSSALSSVSSRRLYTPRDRIASDPSHTAALISSLSSQETIHGHEPSPTPAPRQGQAQGQGQVHPGRARALPPLAIPPSLPTLLSESLLNRSSETPASERSRRKVSSNSNVTVRAEPSLPSVIKPPGATTALTTTTVSDADVMEPSPSMSRSASESSAHTSGATFSRPSMVSSSTLNSLRRQDASNSRARTVSDRLKEELRSPMSGSETERPRTFGIRGRTSLEEPRPNSVGRNNQGPSTVASTRRERRRTITEIFAQADH